MRRARDNAASGDTADDELHVEVAGLDGALSPEPTPERPRRAWRAVSVIAAMLVVVCIAVSGPATLVSLATQTWQQVRARLVPTGAANTLPTHLNATAWTSIHFPAAPATVHGIAFVPASGSSQDAYACWLAHAATTGTPSQLSVAITRDRAQSWSLLDSPEHAATGCTIVVDISQPRDALLLADEPAPGNCPVPALFFTSSWGSQWQHVSLPMPVNAACEPAFFVANGKIYAWSQDGRYALGGPPGSPLMVSSDGGATWANAFASLAASALPAVLGAHADGSLLVQVAVQGSFDTGPPVAPALWCLDGSSGRWSLLANTPETSFNIRIDPDPAGTGCNWAPMYAFSYLVSPSTNLATISALQVLRGSAWVSLPLLPIAGASAQQPLGDVGRVLGEGPVGTLLVDAPDSTSGTENGTPQRTLWAWDPGNGHWLRDYSDEPGIARLEGICWDHATASAPATAVVWMFGVSLGVPPTTGIYYATLASNPVGAAGTS